MKYDCLMVEDQLLLTSTLVAPLASGPYVMYECPVIQPMSAVHQYTSSGWWSNTSLKVVAV